MSGTGPVLTSHDVTERPAWEIQAPLTVRPEDFKPFPATINPEIERQKMLDDLYAKGLLDKTKFIDEELEIEFCEIWRLEGHRARFGAAMMAKELFPESLTVSSIDLSVENPVADPAAGFLLFPPVIPFMLQINGIVLLP